ncbi:RES family NAD+ phosphorylase [Roseicella frigidaeris]|uniref:RES domain-containing protein n=1 Tax=Roseicella frigidaeris TaxID=2230885 RepID=A0A327M3B3_9PROT|nr:RES domain-containing protein [Roseicella frigidaeris]
MTDRRARARPPRRAADLRPATTIIPVGARLARLVRSAYPDVLGVGPGPSRFSDPMLDRGRPPRWLPLYLGQSFTLCLQEALLRDRAVAAPPGPFLVAEAELALWDWAEIEVTRPLRLVDLRGAALARSRVPTDVVGAAEHRLARAWAAAFHWHPSGLDGIAFPSSMLCLHGSVA